jgi:hypothetical protein
MIAPVRQSVDAGHRDRVLRALGVTPWVQRAARASTSESIQLDSVEHGTATGHRCVVVLPSGCSTRELDLVGRALVAGGAAFARAPRITVSGGDLEDVPPASAYLVFGEAQAHALGHALPAATMQQAQIALADEPGVVLVRAESKRRLWNAMRTLRRTLATAGG